MRVEEVVEILDGTIIVGQDKKNLEVRFAFGSDLMSDVLAYAVKDSAQSLLLTGLMNSQVIRTAEMLDLCAIVFVRGKTPTEDVIALAEENNVVLISTTKTMYQSAGLLYTNGLEGIPV